MKCPKCGKKLHVIEYCECGWRNIPSGSGEVEREEELLRKGIII